VRFFFHFQRILEWAFFQGLDLWPPPRRRSTRWRVDSAGREAREEEGKERVSKFGGDGPHGGTSHGRRRQIATSARGKEEAGQAQAHATAADGDRRGRSERAAQAGEAGTRAVQRGRELLCGAPPEATHQRLVVVAAVAYPSGCCSPKECGHPQAAFRRRSGAAGREGCPPCPGSWPSRCRWSRTAPPPG
jgi:hypothetical protein